MILTREETIRLLKFLLFFFFILSIALNIGLIIAFYDVKDKSFAVITKQIIHDVGNKGYNILVYREDHPVDGFKLDKNRDEKHDDDKKKKKKDD